MHDRDDARPIGGDNADTGGSVVPPYDGRRESADIDEESTHQDGANVGGATGPRTSEGYSSASPSDTPGGRTASPSDEMPATENTGDNDRPSDPGTGPDHYAGTGSGENQA